MTKNDPRTWKIGQRVLRQDTGEKGTIIQAPVLIRVKWDGGRVSKYDRENPEKIHALED